MAKSQTKPTTPAPPVSVARLRIGLVVWVVSYLPVSIPLAAWLYSIGMLPTVKSQTIFIAVTWGIEILIGWIGLFIGGKQILVMARSTKTRHLPKLVWRAIWTGRIDTPGN